MDSSQPAIRELLEFSCVRPLRTVGDALEAGGAPAMMDDPLVGAGARAARGRGDVLFAAGERVFEEAVCLVWP